MIGPLSAVVGGAAEPDGAQAMSDAEFRMARERLGLTAEWLSVHLGVALRTVRRWEHGHATISDGVRLRVEELEAVAAQQVGGLVAQLLDATAVVLTIPRECPDGLVPPGWWRMIAARVADEVPGLYVRYDDADA